MDRHLARLKALDWSKLSKNDQKAVAIGAGTALAVFGAGLLWQGVSNSATVLSVVSRVRKVKPSSHLFGVPVSFLWCPCILTVTMVSLTLRC